METPGPNAFFEHNALRSAVTGITARKQQGRQGRRRLLIIRSATIDAIGSAAPENWVPQHDFSKDRTTKGALLNTLGEEQAAAWVREEQAAAWARFYAIEVDSRPGELEYERALAAAKRLDPVVAKIVAAR